ncbi:MAG: protein-L-isoaspartate(D-aspartate) O-methyltransferase [Thermoguttaceae bacterium]
MNSSNLELAKQKMLHWHLEQRGICDPRVLAALARVPRERFVPESVRHEAYADRALPIACGQTISQPYIVALMTQALEVAGGRHRVLEIGTGSGYQTAVLAELAAEVVSIERHARLSAQAGTLLNDLGYRNVTLQVGDGTLGCPDRAPFDRILVTAAAAECPPALFAQLQEGGILVIPLGSPDRQVLQSIRKVGGGPETVELSGCRFVPLIGACDWSGLQ